MKYVCVDTAEFLYPDIREYKSGTDRISILTPRGSYACGQVLLYDGSGSVKVTCEGWEPEVYEMVAIPVEANAGMEDGKWEPHTPERKAPFEVYDCLKPCSGEVTFKNGVCAVYFSLWIPVDAPTGMKNVMLQIGGICVPVAIEVSSAVVPEEESLDVLLFHYPVVISRYYNLEENGLEHKTMESAYLKAMRRMRQNGLTISSSLVKITPWEGEDGRRHYDFDFSLFEKFADRVFAMGYRKLMSQIGFRESWEKPTIFLTIGGMRIPSMSTEGYYFLAEYLLALSSFLEKREWTDKITLSVADEPAEIHGMEYRAICGIVRKFAPKLKIMDALSPGLASGVVDIDVVLMDHYEANKQEFDILKEYGNEIWYYDALTPRGEGYINRFMDYTLLASRYHGWANYAYQLKGYLHWAFFALQKGQDPFKQSCPRLNLTGSTPQLPPGDTHLLYPGNDGPWISVRLENFRAGIEEYELLQTLAAVDKEKADAICAHVFRSFKDVEYDPQVFRAVRNELIRALEVQK